MRMHKPHEPELKRGRSATTMLVLLILALATSTLELAGQSPAGPQSIPLPKVIRSSVAEVPFGPGETSKYQVKLGPFSVGDGLMQVVSVEPVRGHLAYFFSWKITGGIPLARVDDHYRSWVDVETLSTLRSIQEIREVRYRANRFYEIYPEAGYWERTDNEDREELATDLPLDDISFIYFARTLPLEVGETYTLDRYFRADRNPVILKVLRKETIKVPAGTFDTIVVQPIIQARGLFGEGGEAEVYFTDDDRRILVRLSSKVPIMGSLSLHLKDYQPGVPLER